ncbi:hypothetical protein E8E14_013459 [Neopestalotiopsis sp. 37M]|nr:hypothetical protein E8E14_013459 [Neopestalotiopsis sp. 37M]
MAEVLGGVASGIAVVDATFKIGSGIIKLKRLWDEVKDVPDTIKSLMQRLELLAVVMGEMEAMHQSNTGDATLRPFNSQGMQLSMMRCREAMDTLEDLVTKLTKHVDSQKRLRRAKAKLKVALGKDDLNQCQGRLSDVVQLLQLAQSCYQTSLNGAMLQRLIAMPTHFESQSNVEIMAIGSFTAQSELEPEMRETNSLTAEGIDNIDARSSAFSVQKTSWTRSWYSVRRSLGPFASYAWDSRKTDDYENGFVRKDLRFRFELAQWLSGKSWEIQFSRSMSGWQHHLRTYNIVPYDSEVMQSAMNGDIDRIKYLFANNLASIHDRDFLSRSLLYVCLQNALSIQKIANENATPAFQPDFYETPLIERIVRENGSITRNDAVELAESHINLLSLAALSFVRSQFMPWFNQAAWNELIHELVLTIGDVNLQQEEHGPYDIRRLHDYHRGNPLMLCIFAAEDTFFVSNYKSYERSFGRHLRTEIMKWLQVLQDCNVDLESYGQHEHDMIFRKDSKKRLYGSRTEGWAWTGFSWGPDPNDWVFYLDRVVERFSGDFWRLIDNPIQQVPGAWIDNDDDFWDEWDLYSDDSESELEDDTGDDSDHESDDKLSDDARD